MPESRALLPALPLVAASFIAGTVGGALLGGPWWATLLVAVLAAAAVAVAGGHRALDASSMLLLVALIATAAAGHARVGEADGRPQPLLATLDGSHEVVGIVRADPRLSGTLARLDLRVESIDDAERGGGLRLTLPAPREPLREGDRIAGSRPASWCHSAPS